MARLADLVAAEHAQRRRPECHIGSLLKQLDTTKADREIAADLRAVLASTDASAPEISRALKTLGHNISPSPIARHRRSECACR